MDSGLRGVRGPLAVSFVKILTAAALWSTIGVASVYGGDYVLLAFFRSATAAAASLALTGLRPPRPPSLLAGLLLGALFVAYPLAAVLAGVGTAAYLLYTAPLWTALESRALGEELDGRTKIAIALVLAAIALMSFSSLRGELNPYGLLTGVTSGVIYGSYIAVARYYSSRGDDVSVSLGAMLYTLIVAAPAAGAYALIFRPAELLRPALFGLYLGLFGTMVPYRLFASGVRFIGAAKAAVLAVLEPALAALWGYIFFGQTPTSAAVAGYALITAAAFLASR
ncbi:MAG: DMT family transporter [Thermoproteus sp.]|nr:DMT family transporter [Thermoproteus sp.]